MKAGRRLRTVMSTGLAMLVAMTLLALAPAASRGDNPWSYPFISSVSPPSAPVGSLITINGSDFFDSPGSVTLGSVASATADIVSWSESKIEAIVPQDAYGGAVTVTRSDGDAYPFVDFYVEASVTSVFPAIAVPGQTVTVKGGGFCDGGPSTEVQLYTEVGATTVKGMNMTQLTNTQIKFKASDIPGGTYQLYVSTYVSTVTTARIESNRTTFTAEGNPVLEGASPNPCPAGATLTVKGGGFGEVKASDFNIELYDTSTGESYDDFDFFEWTPDSVRFNTLPSFEGEFKIIVSRGMSCPSPPRQAAQVSNEIDVTFTRDPVPPEDIVGQTSRTWGHDSIGTTSPAKEWYLAEASTAPNEESWILVQNPNVTPANVTLNYVTSSAVKEMPPDIVEGNSRKTYDVAVALPSTPGISVEVKSDIPVVAEKAVYGNNRTWAHESIGVSKPSKVWYLAEGCTAAGFEGRVAVMNPGNSDADVTLTYMTPSGPVAGPAETIPANSRTSYDISANVPDEWSVSTEVKSDVPVVAERAMFGNNRTWAHDSIGVMGKSTVWYLAEGCTAANFETWVLVQNPGDSPANVTLTYMTPSGAIPGPTESVGPKSRRTFEVAKDVPGTWEVSIRVASDQPVIAERSLYGNNRIWAHDSVGVTIPNSSWFLGEGCTLPWLETWVLVQNPNDQETQIKITYNTTSGAVAGPAETLPANSRKTYNPAHTVNNCADISTKVESDNPIVVERAMYGDQR